MPSIKTAFPKGVLFQLKPLECLRELKDTFGFDLSDNLTIHRNPHDEKGRAVFCVRNLEDDDTDDHDMEEVYFKAGLTKTRIGHPYDHFRAESKSGEWTLNVYTGCDGPPAITLYNHGCLHGLYRAVAIP